MCIVAEQLKRCNACGQLKPLSCFHRHHLAKDGRRSDCKECRKIYEPKHRNPETRRLHEPRRKEVAAKYRANNKDKIRAWRRLYCKKNAKRISAYHKNYLATNKDIVARRKIMRRDPNTPLGKASRLANRRRRHRELNVPMDYSSKLEEITRFIFSNKCFKCGSTYKLNIDHHFPLSLEYGLFIWNAVLLCNSCNATKYNRLPYEFYSLQELVLINEKLGMALAIAEELSLSADILNFLV